MKAPLAGELSNLLIIFSKDQLDWLLAYVLFCFNQQSFLNEDADATNYRLFVKRGLTQNIGDHLLSADVGLVIQGQIPDLIHDFNASLSNAGVRICGSQGNRLNQTGQRVQQSFGGWNLLDIHCKDLNRYQVNLNVVLIEGCLEKNCDLHQKIFRVFEKCIRAFQAETLLHGVKCDLTLHPVPVGALFINQGFVFLKSLRSQLT